MRSDDELGLNGDGSVNFADLLILAQNYGQGTAGSPAAASSLDALLPRTAHTPRRRGL